MSEVDQEAAESPGDSEQQLLLDPDRPLTPRQERFCLEYLKDLNGTQAAIRAGYTQDENAAGVQASRMLRIPKIHARLNELTRNQFKRLQVDSDQILREISRLGYSDVRGLYNDDGTIKHPKEWPDDLARAVASIEVEEIFEGSGQNRTWIGYTKKVKLWPKEKALDLLGKHKKLFTDKVELSGRVTLEHLVTGLPSKDGETPKEE